MLFLKADGKDRERLFGSKIKVEINEKKWRLFIIFSWNAYYSL